jgi:uncharacterized protein with NAD-binding domain and iron-sulfur cluster
MATAENSLQKIAILGGGIAALSTAFELTSQPDWQSKFDITLYQLGWRLGGKCATARGPNDRIEEHGIHGFLGSYYNALPLMARCYEALGRPAGAPLATFHDAFKPESFVLMWEYASAGSGPNSSGSLQRWPFTAPTNSLDPANPADFAKLMRIDGWLAAAARFLQDVLQQHEADHAGHASGLLHGLVEAVHWIEGKTHTAGLVQKLQAAASAAEQGVAHDAQDLLAAVDKLWTWLQGMLGKFASLNTDLRRLLVVAELMVAMLRGCIKDDVATKGFDALDNENFSAWLARHGASSAAISSPMALNTVNLSYQYPQGDTTRTALMGAGCYLHWTLRSFAFLGAFAWTFEAGTGETVIAPLYEVLKRRGVKFEFFQKVQSLSLSADKQSIAAVNIGVQATLKNPATGYLPLIDCKGLPSWPGQPLYEQLVEGDALKKKKIDLESYWTPWQPVAQRQLVVGQDFDKIVFAISIGAVPYLCQELQAANPRWQTMTDKVTTVQTQTMQLWFKRNTTQLGWDVPMRNPTDCVIGATYLNPLDGSVDFTHLLPWENWPASATPQALWYFSGAMDDYETPPPFTDTDYPRRAHARVKAQCIQYLQTAIGPLLPQATTNAISPPGDPMGLDFSLLQGYDEANAGQGAQRFSQQFWRANIDPTERYVTSPPGSTAARIKAWDTGFKNLVIAGDWIYTGLNVGSVEGTVMSGRLASYAVSGYPALRDIAGYPAQNI